MSVITISRGSYSYGREVAEKVSRKLNYRCIARDALIEASKKFNIPELKLLTAIKDAPSILDRFTYGKEDYIAYIQSVILDHLRKDDVVYHGFAGHFFVKDIPHVLKVRILADQEYRVKLVMERDGVGRKKALNFIDKLDNERRKWSIRLYGIDTSEPGLYDLVLHIQRISPDQAADIIVHTVGLESFQTTAESQRAMDDRALAAKAKAAVRSLTLELEVSAKDGMVYVKTQAPIQMEEELMQKIQNALLHIPELRDVKVTVLPLTPY